MCQEFCPQGGGGRGAPDFALILGGGLFGGDISSKFLGGYFFGGVPPNFRGRGSSKFSGGGIFGGVPPNLGGGFGGSYFFGGGSPPEYGQRSAGTHPTGMHSCLVLKCWTYMSEVYFKDKKRQELAFFKSFIP